MAKVTIQNGLMSFGARGKYGKPNGIGETFLGWSELGDDNHRAGYYQYHWNGYKKYYNICKFWEHVIHTSEPAMARKAIFRDGVNAWKLLTDEQKLVYNRLKYPYAQTGFTRFMSKYLKEHN